MRSIESKVRDVPQTSHDPDPSVTVGPNCNKQPFVRIAANGSCVPEATDTARYTNGGDEGSAADAAAKISR
ncbi:MAG: hypothetical protein ABJF50_06955 [Paracoccaceae bacterium]